MGHTPHDRVAWDTPSTAVVAPVIWLEHPTQQHGMVIGDLLAGDRQTELIKPAEGVQIGGRESSVEHVEVFQLAGVRTSIFERPRPSNPHRRALSYTLICEEPATPQRGRFSQGRRLLGEAARTMPALGRGRAPSRSLVAGRRQGDVRALTYPKYVRDHEVGLHDAGIDLVDGHVGVHALAGQRVERSEARTNVLQRRLNHRTVLVVAHRSDDVLEQAVDKHVVRETRVSPSEHFTGVELAGYS